MRARNQPYKPLPVTQNNIAFRVINSVMDRMFEPENRRLQAALDHIIDQQEEIESSGGYLTILYNGEQYFHSRSPSLRIFRMLDISLHDQMEAYLKDEKEVELDKELIKQTLFKLVFNWRDNQDFRNRLPDMIVPILSDGFQNLQRTVPFEEAVCLKERDKRQFEKIEPKLAMYAMARLMY